MSSSRKNVTVPTMLVLALVVISSVLPRTDAASVLSHPLSKRSFFDIQCKGVYDKSVFARLDRVCEDCYNLYRDPDLHSLCRKDCFTSKYFKGCRQALALDYDEETVKDWIKTVHGRVPF